MMFVFGIIRQSGEKVNAFRRRVYSVFRSEFLQLRLVIFKRDVGEHRPVSPKLAQFGGDDIRRVDMRH